MDLKEKFKDENFLRQLKMIDINSLNIEKSILDIAQYIKNKEELADERLKQLNEYKKDEEIKKLLEENERLRRTSIGGFFTPIELEKLEEFNLKHYNSCKHPRTELIVGNTGIGHYITCRCTSCKEEEDITDIGSW